MWQIGSRRRHRQGCGSSLIGAKNQEVKLQEITVKAAWRIQEGTHVLTKWHTTDTVVPLHIQPVLYMWNCTYISGKLWPEDGMAQLALISTDNLPCFLFLEAAWGLQPHTHICSHRQQQKQPDNMCQSLLKATGWTEHMLPCSRTIQSDVRVPSVKASYEAAVCPSIHPFFISKKDTFFPKKWHCSPYLTLMSWGIYS